MLGNPGKGFDGDIETVEVLHVDVGDDVDASIEDLLDILPALDVAPAGHIGVGQLVDKRHLGSAGDHGVGV